MHFIYKSLILLLLNMQTVKMKSIKQCPNLSILYNGQCMCKMDTMTFKDTKSVQLFCQKCLDCADKCRGSKYDCNNRTPYPYVGKIECQIHPEGYYVKHSVFEKCHGPCDGTNEEEQQECKCDQNRKCGCIKGKYRDENGDCTKNCSKCTHIFHRKVSQFECTSMPEDMRCTEHPSTPIIHTTAPLTTPPATTPPATTPPATTPPATTLPATTLPATTPPATTLSSTTGKLTTPTITITALQTGVSKKDINKKRDKFPDDGTPKNDSNSNQSTTMLSFSIFILLVMLLVMLLMFICRKRLCRRFHRFFASGTANYEMRERENSRTGRSLLSTGLSANNSVDDSDIGEFSAEETDVGLPDDTLDTKIMYWMERWRQGILVFFEQNSNIIRSYAEIALGNTANYNENEYFFTNASNVIGHIKVDRSSYTIRDLFDDLNLAGAPNQSIIELKNHIKNNS